MPSAPLSRRLFALALDWFLALLVAALVTRSPFSGPDAASPFVALGVFFVYVTLLTGTLGFTIGKRIFGLRVERPNGAPPALWRAAVRTGLLCLVIPPVIMTEDQRGLHDVAVGTRVTRL